MATKSYVRFNILLAFTLSLLVGCSKHENDDGVPHDHSRDVSEQSNSQDLARANDAGDESSRQVADVNKLRDQISITNPFIKELPPGKSTAAMYMLLTNHSSKTQALNYVHSPIAEAIEVHRVIYEDGMMKMRQVKHLQINPGQKLVFEPGGYHLMVFGIDKTLPVGSTFPVTMEFEGGLTYNVDVLVKPHG